MWYEINVSQWGKHLFATHKRSITTVQELEYIIKLFEDKFPEYDGYKITVSRFKTVGEYVDLYNLKGEKHV